MFSDCFFQLIHADAFLMKVSYINLSLINENDRFAFDQCPLLMVNDTLLAS
jgi:hypothetical protein